VRGTRLRFGTQLPTHEVPLSVLARNRLAIKLISRSAR
jgi:hypothetical protein